MALLIYAGTEDEDLHNTLAEPGRSEGIEETDWTVYEKSKTKLQLHFSPKQCNSDFAIFELLRMKTEPSERITNYETRLRNAASKCNFTSWSAEKMIKSLIISNMHDDTLRLKFLQKDRTLDQILDIARKKEDAVARSKVMDGDSRSVVNKVADKRNYPSPRIGPPDQCNRCGHEKRTSSNRNVQLLPEFATTAKRKDTMPSVSGNKRKQGSGASRKNPKPTVRMTPTRQSTM